MAKTLFQPAKKAVMVNDSREKRLLVINPNATVTVTQRLEIFLQPLLPKSVRLVAVTARFGASYISCEASHAVAAHAALDAWAGYLSEQPAPDGVLIACFGDPGLFALKQSSHCPVTGLAEAAFIEAAAHGEFAIVTGGQRWKPMLSRLAQSLGFESKLQHIEIVEPTGAQLMADPQMAMACLQEACRAAQKTGVKAIVVGGAGLAGYAQKLQANCDLPLIDSVTAGLQVLLEEKIPVLGSPSNSFQVDWQAMPAAMKAL